jgi:hypothetical protein
MKIIGYKIVYDIIEEGDNFTSEVQAHDLPMYLRKAIDRYFDSIEEESEVVDDNQ